MSGTTLDTAKDKPVMLRCGCAAHARKKVGEDWVPSCVVHDCIEQVATPILDGRIARCDCGNTRQSSPTLPFFTFQGDGSPKATDECKCGAIERLHRPYWEARFKITRRWFKIERYEESRTEGIHAVDEEEAKAWADAHARRFKQMGEGKMFNSQTQQYEEGLTRVYSVDLLSLKRMPAPKYHIKVCGEFRPAGAAQYDRFYCGCRGWN